MNSVFLSFLVFEPLTLLRENIWQWLMVLSSVFKFRHRLVVEVQVRVRSNGETLDRLVELCES